MANAIIMSNLEYFAAAIVEFLSNTSIERMQSIYKEALEWYLRKAWHPTRKKAFEKAVEEIMSNPEPIARLQNFLLFINEGSWEEHSANPCLTIKVIRQVDGFENDEKALSNAYLRKTTLPLLTPLLIADLKLQIELHKSALIQKEANKKEIAAITRGKRAPLEKRELFLEEASARAFAMANPDKQAFHLSFNGMVWQMTWYDLTGKPNSLQIKGELQNALNSLKVNTLPAKNSLAELNIKRTCGKLVEEVLARTQVFVEPTPTLLVGLASSYVLTRNDEQFQLFWHDSLGKSHPVVVENHPQFAEWLNTKSGFLEEDLLKLKTYLQHIRVRREVDEVKHAHVGQTLQENHGITLVTTDNLQKIPGYKRIAGTYFLTREPQTRQWALYQKQKGEGNLQKIDTDNWEAFRSILAKNDRLSAEQLNSNVSGVYDLCLMSKDSILEKNKLYFGFTEDGLLQYSVISPSERIIIDTISKKELNYELEDPLTTEQLNPLMSDLLRITAKRGHIRSIAEEVRGCIKNTDRQKQTSCIAVKDFSPQDGIKYSPNSFIITKQAKQWQLFYIDTLQKAITVDSERVDDLSLFLDQCSDEPESLNELELTNFLNSWLITSQLRVLICQVSQLLLFV